MQPEPLRVMLVDDSVVIRGMISRWLGSEPDIVVAASLRTGLEAVNQVERINPDIAVLDIEMPELDGISALPQLLAKKRNLIVIMASTLTRRNAEISFKALSLGASDYIPKPESTRESTAAETFRHDLVQKDPPSGRQGSPLVSVRRRAHSLAPAHDRVRDAALRAPAPVSRADRQAQFLDRKIPRVLLIGSSTGGPQALMSLVAEIGPVIDRFPVLITQHMPPTFTTILAEHLARASHRPAREAIDGEAVKAGHIYLAPGGRHMRVVRHGIEPVIALDDGPPINFCKPAVDPLFTSADRRLAGRHSGAGPDRNGFGRHARRQGYRRRRRQRDRTGRSYKRGVGHAGRGSACRHLCSSAAAQSDRAETGQVVFRRSLVTPLDYEFLRKLLKERSGLDLSADKQYLVESRLVPLARKASLAGISRTRAEDEGGVRRAR